MAGTNKTSANQLFSKISAYSTIVQQNLGKFLNKLSPYAKEYESSLDLIIDILRSLGYSEERLVVEILEAVTGEATIASLIESGYHGALNSLESKLALIESKQDDSSFIAKLEDAVKVTISTILTSFLSCSVSPFIPKERLDVTYKKRIYPWNPINIPTHILDFSNTLHVSPVSESGIYFYNTGTNMKFYRRDSGRLEETTTTVADVRDKNAERYMIYTYTWEDITNFSDEEKKKFKKVVSIPRETKIKLGDKEPEEFIYVVRPSLTSEGLYKTFDMNAFIWYVANRGDNTDDYYEGTDANTVYEYNKLLWDSRRMNARNGDTARSEAVDWDSWLKSRKEYDKPIFLEKEVPGTGGNEIVEDLYPILQLEPSELYGNKEHIIATFPAQRYLETKTILGQSVDVTKTIYKFNADYLKSIKIFNWKTIIMNLLYELNGISPVPDIALNISLSDEIIDARLSTLILNTITADDKEVDDSYYSFTNEDYSEALKRMELKKYQAKAYDTAGNPAIQNQPSTALDVMNSVSTAATLNEITSTITRGVYSVAGTSGSTGITKTTLSYELAMESNFLHNLLFAIIKPFVRALLSPQVMLLFCINLDVMGLINISELGQGDFDLVSDFIFRKLAGIIKKLVVQVKDAIVLFLLEVVKKEVKKLMDEVVIIILLEQMNDYIRLLTQIMDFIRKFGIGKTINGIDEVNYADIIPLLKAPEV